MKSEKASVCLEKCAIQGKHVTYEEAIAAVDMAEQEAEERIKKKAHKIVKDMIACIFQGDMPQKIADEFIQKLDEE